MARRRYRRRNEGLIEIAIRSDWKVSAGLAVASVFVGTILVPAFLGGRAMHAPIGAVFSQLAWFAAFGFALIALVRLLKQRAAVGATMPSFTTAQRRATDASAPTSVRHSETGFEQAPTASPSFPAGAAGTRSAIDEERGRVERPAAWSLDVLDRMEWKRFEDLCCAFYREKGIRAETTRLGADGGIDIRLFQGKTNPARATAIVQCKAWNKQVGVKEVRELRGVMVHEKVEKAFFMAPKGYTDEARAFAAENQTTLLDGKLFLTMLQRLPEDASKRLLEFATEGDWTTPTCPSCGGRMTARDGQRGPFWGCTSYPKCRGKLPMRGEAK